MKLPAASCGVLHPRGSRQGHASMTLARYPRKQHRADTAYSPMIVSTIRAVSVS